MAEQKNKKMKYNLLSYLLAGSVAFVDGAYWFFSLYNLFFTFLIAATIFTGPAAILVPLAGSLVSGCLHLWRGIRAETKRQKSLHKAQVEFDTAQIKYGYIETAILNMTNNNQEKVKEYTEKYHAYCKLPETLKNEKEKSGLKRAAKKTSSRLGKAYPYLLKFANRFRLTGRTVKNATKLLRNLLIIAGIPLSTILGANPIVILMFATFVPICAVSALTVHLMERKTSNAVNALKEKEKDLMKKCRFLKKQPDIYEYRLSQKLDANVTVSIKKREKTNVKNKSTPGFNSKDIISELEKNTAESSESTVAAEKPLPKKHPIVQGSTPRNIPHSHREPPSPMEQNFVINGQEVARQQQEAARQQQEATRQQEEAAQQQQGDPSPQKPPKERAFNTIQRTGIFYAVGNKPSCQATFEPIGMCR